jgi:hypothetical protein
MDMDISTESSNSITSDCVGKRFSKELLGNNIVKLDKNLFCSSTSKIIFSPYKMSIQTIYTI